MLNTVIQYSGGTIVAIFQTENSHDTWKWFHSAQRYMLNRQGRILGFFDASGDRLEWFQGSSENWNDWTTHKHIATFSLR